MKKEKAHKIQPEATEDPGISKRGWKIIGIGIGVLILGFFILSRTNPEGDNWASVLSPFLILGGYGVIAWGIVAKDPESKEP